MPTVHSKLLYQQLDQHQHSNHCKHHHSHLSKTFQISDRKLKIKVTELIQKSANANPSEIVNISSIKDPINTHNGAEIGNCIIQTDNDHSLILDYTLQKNSTNYISDYDTQLSVQASTDYNEYHTHLTGDSAS